MITKTGFNRFTGILFLCCAAIGLYFQFAYHKFLNIDTLSYINIAERYAAGDWRHAINTFWSPLYSWVLCAFLWVGIPLYAACYIINFAVAAAGLYILQKLARPLLTRPIFYFAFSIYALLLLLYYAMSTLTPDLLSAVLCLWFLLLITGEAFIRSKQTPVWTGIVAALLCFTKLYNFAALQCFFALLFICYILSKKPEKKQYIRPFLKSYAAFMALALVWIAVLSFHEHKLVITTAGSFNHRYVSPGYPGGFPSANRLYALPYKEAYSIHTETGQMLDGYNWSPFGSMPLFLYQLKLIKKSLVTLFYTLDSTLAKWLALTVALLIIFIDRKKITTRPLPQLIVLFGFFLCYPLLYLPLFIIDRYILVCIILFHLFLFYVLQTASELFNRKIIITAGALLLLVSIVPFLKNAQIKLVKSSGEYRYYRQFHDHLPAYAFLQNESIASDEYAMVEAFQLCYHLKCRYFCTWKDHQYASLKKFGIHYIIAKEEKSNVPFLALTDKLVAGNTTIYIYKVL